MTPPTLAQHPEGVLTLDAHYTRPRFAAIHALERGGRLALVDCGTNSSVPGALAALAALGANPEDVDAVFVTHVHLDHAGGAGALAQALPHAVFWVHPRGAPHLTAPERLAAATAQVYGAERFAALYGTIAPVPADRVQVTSDGQEVVLGGSRLAILHTPGHALHHQVLWDPAARIAFTGDTFGLCYPSLCPEPLLLPTTTPTQFDPEQLRRSIEAVDALRPRALYLTHYGRLEHTPARTRELLDGVAFCVDVALRHAEHPAREQAIRNALEEAWLTAWAAHGGSDEATARDWLSGDLTLNAQGLCAWLERSARAVSAPG